MRYHPNTGAGRAHLVTECTEQIRCRQERTFRSTEDEFCERGATGLVSSDRMRYGCEPPTNRLPRVPVSTRKHGVPFILNENILKR